MHLQSIESIVSVCIPVYNGDAYLKETLESIAQQTYENIEIIIVDDNSVDGSSNIIRTFQHSKFSVIKYKNSKNLGLLGNWKKCVELSSGEWIKFVFQDDILEKKCIEELVLTAQKTRMQLVLGNKEYFYSGDVSKKTKKTYKYIHDVNRKFIGKFEYLSPMHVSYFLIRHIFCNFIGEPSCFLIHRQLMYKYGDYNPNLIQLLDYDYYARIAVNEGLACSHHAFIYFRVHGNSETLRNVAENIFRAERLDKIIMLYTIINDNAYKKFIDYSKDLLYFDYIRTLLVLRSKKAYSIILRSNNNLLISQWADLISRYPPIVNCLDECFFKHAIIYYFCKIWMFFIDVYKKITSWCK